MHDKPNQNPRPVTEGEKGLIDGNFLSASRQSGDRFVLLYPESLVSIMQIHLRQYLMHLLHSYAKIRNYR